MAIGSGPCGPCGGAMPTPFGGPASGLWTRGRGSAASSSSPTPTPVPAARQGPTPVDFNSAAFFKILAKSGISNVPTSSIIGNMGVSPIGAAAITGFALVLDGSGEFSTSAQVIGNVYAADYSPPTPALLTQAVLDMEAAYTDAATRVADFVDVNAGNLGGLSLIPGVYSFSTGVTIPSNLTLVGGPNDTWIFQIPGTLGVSSGVEIVMAGGALGSNVIWQVAGATTIGTNATFRGNILDLTNIAVQTGASVFGKLLAQTAVTLDQNLING